MKKFKVNDFVTILSEAPDSPDRRARVVDVTIDGVYVSNMNMPFLGNFCHKFFKFDEVSK